MLFTTQRSLLYVIAVSLLAACTSPAPWNKPAASGNDRRPTPQEGQAELRSSTQLDECVDKPSEWIYCSSFEEHVSRWNQGYDASNRIEDPGPLQLSGNHVGRVSIAPDQRGASFIAKLPPHVKLYLRYYVKWEEGYVMSDPHHGPGGLAADADEYLGRSGLRPDGSDLVSASLEAGTKPPYPFYSYTYYHGMYQDCPDINIPNPGPDRCFGDSLPCVSDAPGRTYYCQKPQDRPRVQQGITPGQWYCIEEMVDLGKPTTHQANADGALDVWVNGTELGPFKPLWMRTSARLQLNKIWLFLYFHKGHGDKGLLFDDVVVSTTRVGCRSA